MTEVYAAGAVAAFTIDLLVYPLDTLKTRYQSQDYIRPEASTTSSSASSSSASSSSRAAGKPLALRGLYQGVGSVILATVPAAGLFFSTYENAKVFLSEGINIRLPEPVVHASASAVAEMASCIILAPAEVIKSNAQMLSSQAQTSSSAASGATNGTHRSTSVEAFRMLARDGGGRSAPATVLRRLFTGYSALVARNLPFTALQFPAFEYLRSRFWERRDRQHPGGEGASPKKRTRGLLETGLVSGVSAGTAGAAAAWITTPSDVVKVRMMLSAAEGNGNGGVEHDKASRRARGAWATTKRVFAERGVRGFFRGAAFRAAWTALGSGLYLGTYETSKLWLTRDKDESDDGIL